MRQCRITRVALRPHQFGLGDEPQRRRSESQVMLPGPIFLGLEFVPADFRLGVLKGALGKVAAATPHDETGLGGVRRGIEQCIRAVALTIASYHQPFGAGSLACGHSPDALHREVCSQPPTFRQAHLHPLSYRLRMLGQGAYLLGSLTTQHSQSRAPPASLAPLRGQAYAWHATASAEW